MGVHEVYDGCACQINMGGLIQPTFGIVGRVGSCVCLWVVDGWVGW